MLYIFLDIDGVLNTETDWKIPFKLNDDCLKKFIKLIDLLKPCKLILSSSWRQGWDSNGNSTPQIKILEEKLSKYNIRISDITPKSPDKDRAKEINYYIKRHNIDNYIVLDDTPSEFISEIKNLYLINYKTGITEKDIKKIHKERR